MEAEFTHSAVRPIIDAIEARSRGESREMPIEASPALPEREREMANMVLTMIATAELDQGGICNLYGRFARQLRLAFTVDPEIDLSILSRTWRDLERELAKAERDFQAADILSHTRTSGDRDFMVAMFEGHIAAIQAMTEIFREERGVAEWLFTCAAQDVKLARQPEEQRSMAAIQSWLMGSAIGDA